MLCVLAVDLGSSKTGWAYFAGPELLSAGTWDLEPKRHQSRGMRWLRLRAALDSVLDVSGLAVDLVAYEEVRRHSSRTGDGREIMNVAAAHAYGAAEGCLLAWCEVRNLNFTSTTIGDIKRAATGKGGGAGTDKAAVYDAAVARWPRLFPPRQDGTEPEYDSSDAAFIGLATLYELGEAKPAAPPPPPPKPTRAKKTAPAGQPDLFGGGGAG